MILAIDVGNTQTVVGLLEGLEPVTEWRLSTNAQRTADEIRLQLSGLLTSSGHAPKDFAGSVLSCVVPSLDESWQRVLLEVMGEEPVILSSEIDLPIELAVDYPHQVGTDRIANAVAGRERCGAPMLVVDCGTTINIDVIDAQGRYIGGAILPGPEISADALFQRAAKLPRVAMIRPEKAIGANTLDCIQSGLFHGLIGTVNHLVDQIQAELGGKCPVITTGGLGQLIAPESDRIDEHVPKLTLEGLALIWAHLKD